MPCAPSTVPMLGCCGDNACDWFFFDGQRRVHSGFVGASDHYYETLTESAEVSGLGSWFINHFASQWGNGSSLLPFETSGSHPGVSVSFSVISNSTLTDDLAIGPARFYVNGIDAGIATVTRRLIRRSEFRSVHDYTIAAMAGIRSIRIGAFRYNLFVPSRGGELPRALIASDNLGDLTAMVSSVPNPSSLPYLSVAIGSTQGGGANLVMNAGGVSVGPPGESCVATFTNTGRTSCHTAARGSFVLFPEPPILDTINFVVSKPPFYAQITPNTCDLSQPFGRLCCP